jgi:uncharacterized membrane protein YccC
MAEPISSLQAATRSLRVHTEWLKASVGETPGTALQHLADLNEELAAAREVLSQALSQPANAAVEAAVAEYRDCLRRLQEVLPIVQSQLLAQRARIEPEQVHVQAAVDWVSCNAQTGGYSKR